MIPWQCETRRVANRTLQLCLLLFTLVGGTILSSTDAQARPGGAETARLWVTADFNGDHKTDLVSVTVSASGGLRTTNHKLTNAAVTLPSGVPTRRLRARDIDGDADADLVLETLSAEPIAVWLNDGQGNFKRASLDDFRFQLSHQTPFSLSTAREVAAPDALDDLPGTDFDAPVTSSVEALVSVSYFCSFQALPRTTFRHAPSTRGPPQNS